LHYKLSFDGTNWTVDKATLIDTIDTNVGDWGDDLNISGNSGERSLAFSRTIYDPDNDWYIKFWYFAGISDRYGRNAATYNATGDANFGEGFVYMIWDDADVNDYAGLYMVKTSDVFGIAKNTVSAGGSLVVDVAPEQVVQGQSFPSVPTGKPLSRVSVGPDGNLVTYRTRPLDTERTSSTAFTTTIGTGANTDTFLFGYSRLSMP
jgi:hypothetical protein